MDKKTSTINFEDEDFEAIEQAVLETERGRWFLAEYAARNRRSETSTLLTSIARLEKAVAGELRESKNTTSGSVYQTLAADMETLIAAIALPRHQGQDPIDGLAKDVSSNAFSLASAADKMRDQIDRIEITGLPAETLMSLTQSINQIISLSARQNQLGREVEALVKILSFCRDRLALAEAQYKPNEQPESNESVGFASLRDLRRQAFALMDADKGR